MSYKSIKINSILTVPFFMAALLCGSVIAFTRTKSSNFYSSYDARELVKTEKYKGIDFAYGDASNEATAELRDGSIEKTKSISYGCRIQTTGDDKFNLTDFLNWLAEKTIKQIENSGGKVIRQRYKSGKRFYIEYTEKEFAGRVEIDGDIIEGNQMSLDVEITESNKK